MRRPLRYAWHRPAPDAGATMDINVFYDQLADHGTWVEHPDYRYVFVPTGVGPGWRPLSGGTLGLDRRLWLVLGFLDEPFGWATYHYGRWSYDPAYGWFWVPGDTWAPAWVKWRRGGGRTGWAPIAPDRDGFATGRASHYDAPVAESWVFIDDQYMGERDIGIYAAPIPRSASICGPRRRNTTRSGRMATTSIGASNAAPMIGWPAAASSAARSWRWIGATTFSMTTMAVASASSRRASRSATASGRPGAWCAPSSPIGASSCANMCATTRPGCSRRPSPSSPRSMTTAGANCANAANPTATAISARCRNWSAIAPTASGSFGSKRTREPIRWSASAAKRLNSDSSASSASIRSVANRARQVAGSGRRAARRSAVRPARRRCAEPAGSAAPGRRAARPAARSAPQPQDAQPPGTQQQPDRRRPDAQQRPDQQRAGRRAARPAARSAPSTAAG